MLILHISINHRRNRQNVLIVQCLLLLQLINFKKLQEKGPI
jgi:hypothetical protein